MRSTPRRRSTARVLVVEGDSWQRDLLVSLLRHAEYDAVGVEGVVAALDAQRAGAFDVLVTESRLPDGFADELIKRQPITHDRIVVLAADDDVHVPPSVVVLTKPVDPARLRAEIDKCADR